ncbi:slipin family protein [Mesorhizobium sp. WSM4904]|uniref:slipin family protein n=1 Tax=Mesorhizobium sp. WSM4904 TaxID=3038545 RepID=UPI002418AB5E|nr:slipin family protein [Mesorhizobium sp. WSM4904]WFP60378.1 slipin family protein [Mesorhizobium sp. WSM4904]
MKTILEKLLGRQRVLVKENERAIALYKGEIQAVLMPGEHWLANRRGNLEVSRHDLKNPEFVSAYEKALFDKLPDVAARHFTVVRTGRADIAVIERDGVLHAVLAPDRKLVLWTDAGPWKVTSVDTAADLAVDPALMRRIGQARKTEHMFLHPVTDGQVGLLFVDGVYTRALVAGVHAFWNVGRMVQVKVVDLKRQSLDVAGQEMLTKDRVTIRVNIVAEYRVVDPVTAVSTVKDFSEALYRALQYAFRKTLGALTLDQILDKKVTVDEEAAAKVRADMAAIGLEVSDIALKDVILPGEMREILNQVVSAEKQAEVALEAIAGKVERLTVHNGTGGLLNDLVKLRES